MKKIIGLLLGVSLIGLGANGAGAHNGTHGDCLSTFVEPTDAEDYYLLTGDRVTLTDQCVGHDAKDKIYPYTHGDEIRGQSDGDDIFGGEGSDTLAGGDGWDKVNDSGDQGDTDKLCDGDGDDIVNTEDNDGNDAIKMTSDGFFNEEIHKDSNDSLDVNISCPYF